MQEFKWGFPHRLRGPLGRSPTPLAPLDPSAPPGVTCCPKPVPSSPETEPPRTSPPVAAVRRRGGPPRPNRVYLSILGEPTLDPELFPGQERRRSRRISGEPAASPAKDPIAGLEILAGCFLWIKDLSVMKVI
jgi:hypothetical protein